MKLNLVPASSGAQWVKLGMRTFFKQPLALSGLFFIFLAVMSVLSVVPVVGNAVAFVLMPGVTLGLLAAARQASDGKFPMPTILVIAFRTGPLQRRRMLVLGGLYTLSMVLILCATPLIDGGGFAKLMLLGQAPSAEARQEIDFQLAMLFASGLNMPLTLLFCHASALIHWHDTAPVKSLFFSVAAIAGNFRAFVTYGLVWMGVFFGFGMVMAVLVAMLGSPEAVAAFAYPAAMLVATMVFTSIYFTFQSSFDFTPGDDI
nr:BPSS1780 family membrane protein [uncultured Rhodoferax sp.]